MDISTAMELISKAYEETRKDSAFTLYASIYPYMSENDFITFNEFYLKMTVNNRKSSDEILDEVKELLNFEWEEVI